MFVFFCSQKTAYEMRISDWSSDVCSSDLIAELLGLIRQPLQAIACYPPKGLKDRHGPVQRYRLPAGHWSPVPRIRINSGNAPPMYWSRPNATTSPIRPSTWRPLYTPRTGFLIYYFVHQLF